MSVLVATRGRPGRLPSLVDAVLDDPAAAELIVVVDGHDDPSVEVLRDLARSHRRLVVLQVPHRGQLGALDEAVAVACSEVVLLLDDDILPSPGLVTGHARHHAGRRDLVVVGSMPVQLPDGRRPSVGTRLYANEYAAHCTRVQHGDVGVLDVLWTGNVSLRRAQCRRVGLRSDGFTTHYHADRDLGFRLADAGLTGIFDPTLHAVHLHDRSNHAFLQDARRQAAGLVMLHRAHPQRLGPFDPSMLVADLPRPVARVVRLCGRTAAGDVLARGLLAAATTVGRGRSTELVVAKLVRRIVHWRGATESLRRGAAALRTSVPPPSHAGVRHPGDGAGTAEADTAHVAGVRGAS